MLYIFNFRYKPDTELSVLNEFIKNNGLKWKSRNIGLNNDIHVIFTFNGKFDTTHNFDKIKSAGITIDSIEFDNGKHIEKILIC